jgi:hypothetical protein
MWQVTTRENNNPVERTGADAAPSAHVSSGQFGGAAARFFSMIPAA